MIAAFDALLPAVHPWEFIAAMPEIERLDRSIYEIQFGKRERGQPPPARRAKDHALAALVNAITLRRHRVVRGEQSATLCRYDGDGKVGLTLWPDPGYEHVRFYQLDDEEAVEDAVARLARHFA